MGANSYLIKNMDHLGLVAGFCEEIGLVSLIDQHFPNQSEGKSVSYGQAVKAMLLNGLGFVGRTLHMYTDYFNDKPVERLVGPDILAKHLNDDVLGRCLDQLYEYGVSELYQAIGERVIEHLGLPCTSIHMDSTSFHVDGEYDREMDTHCIQLTKGYSRDHRPELNQAILNLITENQAGIPVYMQACSGNTHDTKSFRKIVKAHLGSLKVAQACRYLVADAALYTEETIKELDEQQQYFITRVPQTLVQAKQVIAQSQAIPFVSLGNGYEGTWITSDYAQVAQRWLLVRSAQATERELAYLKKRVLKSTQSCEKDFKKLSQQRFRCEADAQIALERWIQAQAYVEVAEGKIELLTQHSHRGRPKREAAGVNYYQITGVVRTSPEKVALAQQELGLFILATNDCGESLTMQAMLDHYKSQQSVERGFRFLKSPDFLTSSFFLKKPERIEALLMVMTCCLMVYAALEHQIRTKLRETNTFFPDMKKKPTQRPTARWVFQCFQGIHELQVIGEAMLVVSLSERQKIIIHCLGEHYQRIYS